MSLIFPKSYIYVESESKFPHKIGKLIFRKFSWKYRQLNFPNLGISGLPMSNFAIKKYDIIQF